MELETQDVTEQHPDQAAMRRPQDADSRHRCHAESILSSLTSPALSLVVPSVHPVLVALVHKGASSRQVDCVELGASSALGRGQDGHAGCSGTIVFTNFFSPS